jgi:hypothetical protein
MATERNPFEQMPEDTPSVVPMEPVQETETTETTFEVADDGGVIVNFDQTTETLAEEISAEEWYGNIADVLSDQSLAYISNDIIDNFQADKDSRGDWESMFERGFDLLGLKLEDASEPFEGACTAVHPLLIESAVKFQAKASQELFPSGGPVKAQIMGKQSVQKQAQANRVQNFMNYQLTEQMPEYFDEFERMLFHLFL